MGYSVRQKVTLISRLDGRDKARLIGEAGVHRIIAQIKKIYKDEKAPGMPGNALLNGGLDKDYEIGDGRCSVRVTDEESKVNLNTADLIIMGRLFQVVLGADEVQAQGLAASVIDWRDPDSEVAPGGAEDQFYRISQYSYEAKDAPIGVPEEIVLINGMTKERYEKLREYVTIYGCGKINVNTASRPVLIAAGFKPEMADKFIAIRSGADEAPGVETGKAFSNASEAFAIIKQAMRLNETEASQLDQIAGNFVTDSTVFSIKNITAVSGKNNNTETICIADRKGNILYWRETQ